jgi:DNA mismatch repair protein MutL
MGDCIVQLSEQVSNQIAAGEVVGRPASVVKELVENAVDAGSTEITVLIKDAGRTLVQVIDNGKGMSADDAVMCFKRHATSKIYSAEDLLALVTKGFRGEALASISAIAHVELKTREQGAEMGVKIVVSGADKSETESVACAEGTSFSVKNLFYNVPARRNFLKSDRVELRHIIDEFQRIAMAHPSISFRLQNNGADLFNLKPGALRKRVVAIFGAKHDERLVPLGEETDVVKISGFVGKPSFALRSRGEQFLFVNGRYIRHHLMHKAIMKAYEGVLSPAHFPLYTVFLEVDPSKIDVNIHPTKIEAKFEEDQIIFALLRSAVKRALGRHNVAPSLDFDAELSISLDNVSSTSIISEPTIQVDSSYNPFNSSKKSSTRSSSPRISFGGGALENSDLKDPTLGNTHGGWGNEGFNEIDATPSHVIEATQAPSFFQFEGKYIVTTISEGLIIINARRAHQRILYEGFLDAGLGNSVSKISQKLLFPEPVQMASVEAQRLLNASDILNLYGLELAQSYDGGVEVVAIPCGLAGKIQDCLDSVLEALNDGTWSDEEGRREKLAALWARTGSIPSKKILSEEEMSAMIGQLFACESPAVDPFGKKIYTVFTSKNLEENLG